MVKSYGRIKLFIRTKSVLKMRRQRKDMVLTFKVSKPLKAKVLFNSIEMEKAKSIEQNTLCPLSFG